MDGPVMPTLIVGMWHSTCSACGQPALSYEASHHTRPGEQSRAVTVHADGCGVRWQAIAAHPDAWIHAADRARDWARQRGLTYAGRWAG